MGKNYYGLELAGTEICWSCSDLWQDEMVRLHTEHITGWMDTTRTHIVTETGHVLPVRLGGWASRKLRSNKAAAVDIYGKNWNAGIHNDLVTLKPAA
jgi:hypothetical protein